MQQIQLNRGGGKVSAQHKKSRAKFLRINKKESRKTDAAYMKEVDNFISGCNATPWGYTI